MTGLEMWSGSFSGRSCNFVGPYKGVALKLIKSLERQPQLLRSDMSSYHSVKRWLLISKTCLFIKVQKVNMWMENLLLKCFFMVKIVLCCSAATISYGYSNKWVAFLNLPLKEPMDKAITLIIINKQYLSHPA